MPNKLMLPVLIAVAVTTVGCGHLKEFSPIRYSTIYPRVPNQQRLISQPILQAVEKATATIDLSQYKDRTVRVEVDGVFPHSDHDLLGYVATAVEGEAARVGMRVMPREPKTLGPVNLVTTSASVSPESIREIYKEEEPDVRLIASVDWGGIDLKDHRYFKAWPLAGQIGLGVVGLGVAVPLSVVGVPFIGLPIGITMIVAAIVWAIFDEQTAHTFTMIGRARITLRAIPMVEGLAAAAAVGEGETSIVVDTESDTGYSLIMALPGEGGEMQGQKAE